MMETMEKRKKLLPPSFPKRKKLGPSLVHAEPFIGCMELLFAKTCLSLFWAWANGIAVPQKKKKAWANTASLELAYLLFCFMLISWGCLTSPTFFFSGQLVNLIDPSQKKVKFMEAPQNRRFYGMMECLRLWPTYIGVKGRTLGKTYGIKVRCYSEHLGGHIGNLMGT
jgi:hypothetical protein